MSNYNDRTPPVAVVPIFPLFLTAKASLYERYLRQSPGSIVALFIEHTTRKSTTAYAINSEAGKAC